MYHCVLRGRVCFGILYIYICRCFSFYRLTSASDEQVSFQVADALEQPFSDGQFDIVWSMESGEHMPDKAKVLLFLSLPPSAFTLTLHFVLILVSYIVIKMDV